MNTPHENRRASTSRRDFLKHTGGALAGAALLNAINVRSYASEDNTIKIALIGCGGRGTGAAANALATQGPVKLVAMADVFPDRLESSLKNLAVEFRRQGGRAQRATVSGHGRVPRRPSPKLHRAAWPC